MSGPGPAQLEQLAWTVEASASMSDWLLCARDALEAPVLGGDPAQLRAIASVLRSHAADVDKVRTDTNVVRRDKLPDIWTGLAAASADQALLALVKRANDVTDVFAVGATIVDGLAADLEAALPVAHGGRDGVEAARRMSGKLPPSQWSLIRLTLHDAILEMARGMRMWEEATAGAAQRLRAIAGRATAQRLAGLSLTPVDKLMISAAADGAGPILSANDAERAAVFMANWDPETRQRFADLMATAQSPLERAWLVKAVASGHSFGAVVNFDAAIRPHANDMGWLTANLRPIDPVNMTAQLGGAPLKMVEDTTCGSMVSMVNRAMRDPIYALSLAQPTPPMTAADQIHAEELRIHTETNQSPAPGLIGPWPEWLGTPPGGLAEFLDRYSAGINYDVHYASGGVDEFNLVGQAIAGAEAGNPSMILVGGDLYPDHYIMVVGDNAGGTVVYNPAGGHVYTVDPGTLQSGDISTVAAQTRVWGVIAPN